MPMSHFGLTVSHIPSATSFYLAALQPLGYRFIGHQGDSIGLGIDSADFFITQAPIGTRPSPNHIAFLADSRLVVRECYAAALNSGAHPSGSPRYRNENCSCFNAAVEDLDGNTVEFIFRQPHGEDDDCDTIAPSESQRLIEWQKEVPEGAPEEDQPEDDAKSQTESLAQSLSSKASQAKSKLQTAMDLASTTSRSVKSAATSRGSSRTSPAPPKPDLTNKGLIGIALGAAAGAGLMYAMHRAESKNAQDEADHLAYMSSKKSRARSADRGSRPPASKAETVREPSSPPKAETVKESVAPPPSMSNRETRRFHRNFSTTESAFSRRPPPPDTRAMRVIADTGYNEDDDDVQEAISRYTSLRPHATRNRDDETEYASASNPPRTEAPSGHSMKRATTLPVGAIEDRPGYYLDAPPARSSASRHSGRHGSISGSHASHRSHRRSSNADADLKRHDSGISMHSSRSRRDRDSEAGRRSSAGTIKPARHDTKYDDVQAAVEAATGKRVASKAPDSCYYPAAISLPPSKVESKASREDRASKAPTRVSHRDPPPPPPLEAVESKQSWEDFPGEESDGLGDIMTVMPDDSISCVDLSKRRRRSHSSRHSSSRRSETDSDRTVRPARRDRDDGGRSKHSGTAIPYRGRD